MRRRVTSHPEVQQQSVPLLLSPEVPLLQQRLLGCSLSHS